MIYTYLLLIYKDFQENEHDEYLYTIHWQQFWKKQKLVGGFNPSEKYESIGIIIPNVWKNKSHVPNHQPVIIIHKFQPRAGSHGIWQIDGDSVWIGKAASIDPQPGHGMKPLEF